MPLILFLSLTLGCKKEPEPDACATACLALEADLTTALTDAGETVDAEAWQAMCAAAPMDADCETCFTYIQDTFMWPLGVGWDCGCGLDTEGVAECRMDTGLSDSDAQAALTNCELTCEAQGLPLAGE